MTAIEHNRILAKRLCRIRSNLSVPIFVVAGGQPRRVFLALGIIFANEQRGRTYGEELLLANRPIISNLQSKLRRESICRE